MPGQLCAVASCKSNRAKLKKKGIKLTFHSFPMANNLVSSTIRKEWIHRCKRKDKFNPNTFRICSIHFTPNDYERDLQNELLGLPLRRLLKRIAVPTLNLNVQVEKESDKVIDKTPRTKRAKKKESKKLVKTSLAENLNCPGPSQLSNVSNIPIKTTASEPVALSDEASEEPSTSYTRNDYKLKYEELLLKYDQLKSDFNKKVKGLNKYYKVECSNQYI